MTCKRTKLTPPWSWSWHGLSSRVTADAFLKHLVRGVRQGAPQPGKCQLGGVTTHPTWGPAAFSLLPAVTCSTQCSQLPALCRECRRPVAAVEGCGGSAGLPPVWVTHDACSHCCHRHHGPLLLCQTRRSIGRTTRAPLSVFTRCVLVLTKLHAGMSIPPWPTSVAWCTSRRLLFAQLRQHWALEPGCGALAGS